MFLPNEMDTQLFNPPNPQQQNVKLTGVTPNTYVSIGLFAMSLAGFWAVLNTIYGAKSEISSRLDKLEWNQGEFKVQLSEVKEKKGLAETWSDRDMYQWAAHLQKDNPNLKVPEPKMNSNP